jgi:hypothetical protein
LITLIKGVNQQIGCIDVSQVVLPLSQHSLAKVVDVRQTHFDFANFADVVTASIHNLNPH